MYKNIDISSILLIVFTLKQAMAVKPTISITCKGEHQYLDRNGDCRPCEMCSAGHQPMEYCGYGERHIGYGCQVCPEGSFSLRSDYNACVQCRPCEDWNSEIAQECSAESDQICGPCFEGFFRPFKSDGSLDDECHPCNVAPRGTTQCEKKPDLKWRNIAFIMFGVAALLVLILFIPCIFFLRGRRRRKKKDAMMKEPKRGNAANEPVTAETRESLLQSSGSSRNSQSSEDSRLDGEHRVEIELATPPPGSISHPAIARSPKSVPSSYLSESGGFKNDATRHRSMLQPSFGNLISDSGYSNMPTAEFVESSPHSNDSQSPSNLPTGRYDDLHPSQNMGVYISRPNANSPQSFRISSRARNRPQAGPSSSSENLIQNMDRDSREVGGSRTPINTDVFDVESFDTRSVTEETKPHKIGPMG